MKTIINRALLSAKPTTIIIVILFIHILFSLPARNGDIANFIPWGERLLDAGARGFYDQDFSRQLLSNPNYPPLFLLLCAAAAHLLRLARSMVWFLNVTFPVFPSGIVTLLAGEYPGIFLFKILIAAGNGLLCFQILRVLKMNNQSLSTQKHALLFFLLNPAVIYATVIWGQIDLLPVIGVLEALILIENKKIFSGWGMFIVSVLFKQTAIIFAPVLIAYIFIKKGIRALSVPLFLTPLIFFLVYTPFVTDWDTLLSPFILHGRAVQTASATAATTSSAMNFWAFVTAFKTVPDAIHGPLFPISYRDWGFIATAFIQGFILVPIFRMKNAKHQERILIVTTALALTVYGVFLFVTRLHSRHLIPLIPFLTIILTKKNTLTIRALTEYSIVSALIILNLIYSWLPWGGDLTHILPFWIIRTGAFILMVIFTFGFLRFTVFKKRAVQ